ncbi:PspC domain-containing protein [Pseudoxanthomonas sp. NC8]|nr:PspC domain-containing protein [Pseudoxanthomonas sp. NC8]
MGEHTPLPSWMWRALFVVTSVSIGIGLIAYIALWLFMPHAQSPSPPVQVDPATREG